MEIKKREVTIKMDFRKAADISMMVRATLIDEAREYKSQKNDNVKAWEEWCYLSHTQRYLKILKKISILNPHGDGGKNGTDTIEYIVKDIFELEDDIYLKQTGYPEHLL